MKKMISKFADSLLSREDLKRVKGGYGGGTLFKCCMTSGDYECSSCVLISPGNQATCSFGILQNC